MLNMYMQMKKKNAHQRRTLNEAEKQKNILYVALLERSNHRDGQMGHNEYRQTHF